MFVITVWIDPIAQVGAYMAASREPEVVGVGLSEVSCGFVGISRPLNGRELACLTRPSAGRGVYLPIDACSDQTICCVVNLQGRFLVMAIAVPPFGAPSKQRRSLMILVLALFLGLISLAAVVAAVPAMREPKFECQAQYLTADDGVTPLTADDGKTPLTTGLQECHAEPADHWVPIPTWARGIWKWLIPS
jgi:hypothetical protein